MSNQLVWRGTSVTINYDVEEIGELVGSLQKEGIKLRSKNILENQKKYFIFENEFINQETNLITMFRKYNEKDYRNDSKIYVPNKKQFRSIKAKSNDRNKYKKIISENIIDGDIREFDISLNIIHEVLNDEGKTGVFLDILILLVLANRSNYYAEDCESDFKVKDNFYKTKLNIIDDEPIGLYPIYDWIINDDEYNESYTVKLPIVRQVIIRKQSLKDVEGILEDSKLAYKRIISKKTDDYFNQLNELKDDFLILSQNKNSALRTLHVTFFAWIGYLSIELFNIITKYEGIDILHYLFLSQGTKKVIVIFMFIVALIFIFIGYKLEIESLQETYDTIKDLYKDKILFETELDNKTKFEQFITRPEVGALQKLVFLIIMISLLIRFFIAIPS